MFHIKLKDKYKKTSVALCNLLSNKLCCVPAKIYFLIVAAIFSLFITALIITPYIIRDTLTQILRDAGNKHISITDVDFNPFTDYLAIHGLHSYKDKHPELKIRSIVARLDWRKALSKNIIAESIKIKGAILTVRYTQGQWYIGGFPAKQADSKSSEKNKLHFYIKRAALRNINLRFLSGQTRRNVFIRQIDLTGLNSRSIKQNGQLRVAGTTHGARYNINALFKPFDKSPRFEFRVKLKHFPAQELALFTRQAKFKMNGTVSYTGTWIVNINTNDTIQVRQQGFSDIAVKQFSTPKMSINTKAIKVRMRSESSLNVANGTSYTAIRYSAIAPMIKFMPKNDTYNMRINKLLSKGQINILRDLAETKAHVNANASIQKFISTDKQAKIELLSANRIRLNTITYSPKLGFQIGHIRTGKATFAQTVQRTSGLAGEFNQRLLRAKSLTINNFWIKKTGRHKHKVIIDEVYPRNVRLLLYRDTKKWPILKLTRQAIKKIKLELPPLAINMIRLKGYNLITLFDRSFRPAFRTRVRISKLQVSGIDTRQKKKKAYFLLTGKLDKFTRFHFKGNTRPFTKNLNLNIRGSVNEVILRTLSPYTERFYGYELTSGHMDARFRVNIYNSRLSGRNTITLRRLGLKRVKRTSKKRRRMELPVEAVVKLLSNSKNEITIRVPNKGNLNDPNFQFGINYQKAFESAFKRGVILALKYTQPVGQALTIFSSARKLFTSLRMKPIWFRGGSDYLSFKSRWSLRKVSRIMKKKKKITVKVCAFYTNADIEYFQVESGKRRKSRRWSIKKARHLSLRRATRVKNHLIRKHKIRSGRLFLCKPKYDKRDNKRPRVKLSI